MQLLQLGRKTKQVIHGEPLPLSRKSHLAWMGFSAEGESSRSLREGGGALATIVQRNDTSAITACVWGAGTPCAVDSEGVVRMLNRSLGNTWTPVCDTRESCKSRSDRYWVVGVHENPQQLR